MDKQRYFELITRRTLIRRLPILPIVIVGGILSFFLLDLEDWYIAISVAIAFCIFIPLFTVLFMWNHANSKENHISNIPQRYKFDDSFLYSFDPDGSRGKMNLNTVKKMVEYDDCFLLYVSKYLWTFIPKKAFRTEEDLTNFYTLFKSRGLL